MWRAERLGRLGVCLVLGAAVAWIASGCADTTEETYTQRGTQLIVTPDTSTIFHREPSLNPDGFTVIFSTDWPFVPEIDDDKNARDIAVINIPSDLRPYPTTSMPDTLSDAAFRKVVFGTLNSDISSGGTVQFDPNIRGKSQPVWNPTNGSQFAVVIQNFDRRDRIYICDVDLSQSDEVPVTSAHFIGDPQGEEYFFNDPAWSHDGQWLLFSRYFFKPGSPTAVPPIPDVYEPQALFAMNVSTEEIYQLTSGSSKEGDCAWSPSGGSIVFASNRGIGGTNGRDLYVIDFDPASPGAVLDFNMRRLTYANNDGIGPSFLPEENFDPTWSPDGGSIVFVSTRRNMTTSVRDRSLWIMDSDGSNQSELVFSRQDEVNPSFDPNNSNRLVYASANSPIEAFKGQRNDIWLDYDFQ